MGKRKEGEGKYLETMNDVIFELALLKQKLVCVGGKAEATLVEELAKTLETQFEARVRALVDRSCAE